MKMSRSAISPGSLARGAWPLMARLPQVVRGHRLTRTGDVERKLSIGRVLEDNARRFPDFPALRFEGVDISHAQLNATANQIARLLAGDGIGPGDRVGILMENRPQLIQCVAAIVKLGAIAVVHNTRLPATALRHCVDLAPGKAMIVDQEGRVAWNELAENNDADGRAWYVSDNDQGPLPPGCQDLLAAAELFETANLPATAGVRLGDPCFYVFTSGTTGLPKAAVIRHIRWIKAMGAFGLMALGLKPGQVLYNVLPFYHNTALAVGWSSCAATGACLAIGRRFSASAFWEEMRAHRADAFVYIGELCRFLMNQPPSTADRDHQARAMVGNGLRPDIWLDFKQRFGIKRVYELYGASEANIAFFNILNQDRTVGLCPADYALVECDHDSGCLQRTPEGRLTRVAPGGTGLLLGKVSTQFPYDGYTDGDASEAKLVRDAFEPGDCWFNTGDLLKDLGYRHARFVDRLGDTFRWRGENVATTEVESVAMALDNVEQAAAYGVRIPGTEGRAGMLAFRPSPDADIDQLVTTLFEHFSRHLPDYAIPVFLRRVDQISATGTFKFVKQDLLREAYDPEKIQDPLWFRPSGKNTYYGMTTNHANALKRGQSGY
jgi:acyl-CoA synthetase (AMP-forming)/AMP-acid ligase II